MITVRPSIFCFLGKVATELYGSVPHAIRKRLGVVPDVFAFIAAGADDAAAAIEVVDLKLGTRRPRLPELAGGLQNRLWQAVTYASAAIGNIRVRTDALRRPPEAESGFQLVRGGPDIYIVSCLSDPLGWELPFALAEKIHARNETPPSAGRARGIFPLFHLPSLDEDAEREQALEGLRRLEVLVQRGVLFPSIVLDRTNRNGYPLERWEDLTELLADFIALSSSSEVAGDVWRTFPQVADLHGLTRGPGLCSIGLSRFRFSRDELGEELARYHRRDLQRALARTLGAEPQEPGLDACRDMLGALVAKHLSRSEDGARRVAGEIVGWVERLEGKEAASGPVPIALGVWAKALDRLQAALFERLGEAAQRIENARQELEATVLESPLRESWIARVSVFLPAYLAYLATVPSLALVGALMSFYFRQIDLQSFFSGAVVGGLIGALVGWSLQRRWRKQTFTLGELPESALTQGFPAPRVLESHARKRRRSRPGPGVTIQLWGELRSQVEPEERGQLEQRKASLAARLAEARTEETELVFLDRSLSQFRERVEAWRASLGEAPFREPGRGFSGDVFPADGPRKLYEAFGGRAAAEACVPAVLSRVRPTADSPLVDDLAEEASSAWGREQAADLELDRLLEILDDQPENLLERLSEASAPLWPRPGDQDELLRCFGAELAAQAREGDHVCSLKDETIFLRVLGNVRSGELARA
jgi:hypothetical protein